MDTVRSIEYVSSEYSETKTLSNSDIVKCRKLYGVYNRLTTLFNGMGIMCVVFLALFFGTYGKSIMQATEILAPVVYQQGMETKGIDKFREIIKPPLTKLNEALSLYVVEYSVMRNFGESVERDKYINKVSINNGNQRNIEEYYKQMSVFTETNDRLRKLDTSLPCIPLVIEMTQYIDEVVSSKNQEAEINEFKAHGMAQYVRYTDNITGIYMISLMWAVSLIVQAILIPSVAKLRKIGQTQEV